jgi:hypothetical protein
MARRSPGAAFVGLDLSAGQVAAGQAVIERLGLDNIVLRQADIAALPDDLGRFDYIIAHGVYSWVAPETAQWLLTAARALLAPHGLLYLSFNTLPGWRMRGMLRDVLLDAARGETEPETRLRLAEQALERLQLGLADLPGLAADYLREELKRLQSAPRSYLYHELLAAEHHPVTVREFLTRAEAAGLRYLCDCDLQTLFPASLGDSAEQALADLTDGADVEQWLDFLGTRNFRQALLFRDDAEIDEALSLARFAELSLWADLRQANAAEAPRAAFALPSGDALQVGHAWTSSVLSELAGRYPAAIPVAELIARAAGSGDTTTDPSDDADACLHELFALFARGAVGARTAPRPAAVQLYPPEPQWRPRADALARDRVAHGCTTVPTLDHRNLELDALGARLIGAADGSCAFEDLCALLQAELASGALVPPGELAARAPDAGQIRAAVGGLLRMLGRYGVIDPQY